MQKIAIALSFFILCNISAFCQNKQQLFGIRWSSTFANFTNNAIKNRYTSRGISYEVGITTQIQRLNKMGINAEVGFSSKNIKDNRFGYVLNYIICSITPNYYIKKCETMMFIGGYAAILASYKILNDYPKSGERFQRYDTGLVVGVNQKIIKISNFQISLDARLSKGFIDIRGETWQGITKNYSYGLGVILSMKNNGD